MHAKFLALSQTESRYHITVCQVNTATHAVRWLTQMFWVRKVQISNSSVKIDHS